MWLVNIWKLPISDIGCHRGDGRHYHYCHRGRQHCRNNSKLCINFKTGLGQNHISEKIWHWCRGSTLGFFHPQQHCKRRKQIFMRMLHQPLLGIILALGHVLCSTHYAHECTQAELHWYLLRKLMVRVLAPASKKPEYTSWEARKPTNGTAAIVKHYMR